MTITLTLPYLAGLALGSVLWSYVAARMISRAVVRTLREEQAQ